VECQKGGKLTPQTVAPPKQPFEATTTATVNHYLHDVVLVTDLIKMVVSLVFRSIEERKGNKYMNHTDRHLHNVRGCEESSR
jgi:hypothetical protein